jgi:hypothetical protein
MRKLLLLPLALMGCNGNSFQYAGHDVYKYYPLDGDRAWEYANTDEEWLLEVTKMSPSIIVDDVEVITLEYSVKDPYALMYGVDWSSSSADGVMIHGYSLEQTGESLSFETPIQFAEHEMVSGESNTTETDGYSFTSSFVSVETCYNHWTTDDWQCLHFEVLEDGGAELPFLGEYWIATRWGTSAMLTQGNENEWILTQGSYSSGED